MNVILDQHLNTVFKVLERHSNGQRGNERRERLCKIRDHVDVIRAQHRAEGKDKERAQEQKRHGTYLHGPKVFSACFCRSHAGGALAVSQITHGCFL